MNMKVELATAGGIDRFRVVDCPVEEPGPQEVRIRQLSIGVNFLDIYHRTGLYPLPMPAVLGVEGAGIVEAAGAGVKEVRVGERIVYAGIPGAYASTRLLPEWRAIRLPDDIDASVAAASFLRGLTAHMLLTRTFPARPGASVLIHAAGGGLGTVLTRWAKRLGCRVIGAVGSPRKAEIALGNGADHVIVGRDADLAAEVGRLTGGQGVDFAIDGIGGDTLRKTLECVRRFGVVASVGQAAGPIPPISAEELGPIRALSLARPSVMAYAAEPDTYRLAAGAVIEAIRRNTAPTSLRTYPLVEVAEAHRALEAGETTGSLLLAP